MVGDFTKRTIWLACLFLVLSATFAFGQGIVFGSIAGTVLDPQKAVVVGAKVAAKNVATSVEYKSTTNDQGYFSIRSIPIGTYRVAVEAPNFKKLEVDGIAVVAGSTTDMGPLTLALGATAETVTVEATAPLIETTNAQGLTTFSSTTTANLPINGAFDQLVLFAPGVATAGGAGFGNQNGAQFGVNGQRDRSNNFQIDGQYNNDNSVSGPSIFLTNQDALQEVQVVTNNFGAEYGRNSGSVVNYVTKSGTNNFHGSAFEYYNGSFADSLTQNEKSPLFGFCLPGQTVNCTPPVVPRETLNRWGGTIGGPIIPNKLFFFGSYTQFTDKVSGQVFNSSPGTTPTPAGLATLASCYPNSTFTGYTAVHLLQTMGPFTYTTSNPVAVSPTIVPSVSDGTTTCNNVQFAGVRVSLPGIFNNYEASGRVDFAFSPKDNFFARYLYQQQLATGALGGGSGGGSSFPGGSVSDVPSRGQQIALDWTRNWTSHLVNQLRFSYERTNILFQGGSVPTCTTTSFGSCTPTIQFSATTDLSFGYGNNLPQGRGVYNTQFQDNASWQHGRHVIKFGGEYVRQRSPSAFLPNAQGTFTFADFNSFLADSATRLNLTSGTFNTIYKEQDAALYVGDDWRFRDNLTLNLGVRWEYFQQAINQLAKRTLDQQTGPNPFWAPLGVANSVNTLPFIPNVGHNFAPRMGFAWTPRVLKGLLGENKTVIRGAFSMAYDPAFYNMFLNVATAAPVVNAGTVTPCNGCLPAEGTAAAVLAQDLGLIPTGVNLALAGNARNQTRVSNSFKNPYAEEWTIGVQREITSKIALEVKYLGTHTVGEFMTINANPSLTPLLNFVAANPGAPNPIPAGAVPCADNTKAGFASQRINCDFTNVRLRDNAADAHYNSVQAQLKIVTWHGFTGSASYTFSKNIDNNSEIFSNFNGAQAAPASQDPFNLKPERALSSLDYPHILGVTWQYDLPYHKAQTGALGHLLGGWSLAGTYKYTSGQLWTPIQVAGDTPYCQNSFDGAFFGGGLVSTCRVFAGNPSAPVSSIGQCLNTTCTNFVNYITGAPVAMSAVHWILNDANSAAFFGTPFGNTRRNPNVRGDAVNTVNLNLIKNTKLTEKVSMKLEATIYNLANRGFYGTPDAFPDDGVSFGNTYYNLAGGGGPPFSSSSFGGTASSLAQGLAQRRIVLGAHVIF